MKRLIILCLLGCPSIFGQATTIQDTLRYPNGTLASGRITVSWPAFETADNRAIAAGMLNYAVASGVVNLTLEANNTALPVGVFYTARYYLANGTQLSESWIVDYSSTPVTLAAVRVIDPARRLYLSQIDPTGASDTYVITMDTALGRPKWAAPSGGGGSTVLNGSGVPSGGTGANGDFYIDTTAHAVYGPKSGGVWGSGVSLVGPAGATGATGAAGSNGSSVLNGSGVPPGGTGANGDFYINTAAFTIYGPKSGGAWGSPTSLVGPAGATGATGAAGPGFVYTGVLSGMPGTCTVGQLAFITNATAGQQIYECSATNVWTQNGGAVSSPQSGAVTWNGAQTFANGINVSGGNATIGTTSLSPTNGITSPGYVRQLPKSGLLAEYTLAEGVGRVALNSVYSAEPIYNITPGYPEQRFGTGSAWGLQGTNAAVTDYAGMNPYGEYTASRFQADATGSQGPFVDNITLVSGLTYVASAWIRSNTGSAQAMRMNLCNSNSSDLVIPITWTRLSYSCTAGSSQTYFFVIKDDVGSTAKDVLFWGAQVELGTVPSSYPAHNIQLLSAVGTAINTADPDWRAWGLRLNGTTQSMTGISGQIQKMSMATLYMAIRKVGSIGAYTALLGPQFGINAQNKMSLWPSASGCTTDPECFTWTFSGIPLVDPLDPVNDNLWHVVTGLYDGAKLKLYFDYNETVEVAAASLAEVSFQDLGLGAKLGVALWPGDIGYVAIYNVAHSASQIQSTTDIIRGIMAGRGQTMPMPTPYIAFEGDSITSVLSLAQLPTQGYVYLVSHALSSGAYIQPGAFAVSGSFLSDMIARGTAVDSAFTVTRATTKVLSILIGANIDMAVNPATWVADLKAYCLARKAATSGLKIVIGTLLPRTLTNFNALRNSINTLIHADPSFYDGLADYAANGTIGCDACAANATYYGDGLHPTAAGQAIMATINQAAVQAVLP